MGVGLPWAAKAATQERHTPGGVCVCVCISFRECDSLVACWVSKQVTGAIGNGAPVAREFLAPQAQKVALDTAAARVELQAQSSPH